MTRNFPSSTRNGSRTVAATAVAYSGNFTRDFFSGLLVFATTCFQSKSLSKNVQARRHEQPWLALTCNERHPFGIRRKKSQQPSSRQVRLKRLGELLGRKQLHDFQALIPPAIVPPRDSLIDAVRDFQIDPEALLPTPLKREQPFARRIATIDRVRYGLPCHSSGLDRPPDSFAEQTGCVPRRVADADDPVTGECIGIPFRRDESRMMLNRLSALEPRNRLDKRIQIFPGIFTRIRMNDPNSGAHPIRSPRKYPRIARWRDTAPYGEHRFACIASGRVKIVFRADAESFKSRIKARLFEQRRAIPCRVDQHAASDRLVSGSNAGNRTILQNWRRNRGREANLRARFDRSRRKKLICSPHIDHAHHRRLVIERCGIVRRRETNARDWMIKARRDPQPVQFSDKTSAAGPNRGPDLVVLL